MKVENADEIGELASSFNIMSSSLYKARHALFSYFYQIAQSLIRASEARDPYSKGHSDRVAKYSEEIARKMQADRSPSCLYMEPDLVERTVRDFLTEDVDRVLIDNKSDYDRTQDLVGLISKRSRSKIASTSSIVSGSK